MKQYKHKQTCIIVEEGTQNKNYYYAFKENEAIAKWIVEDSLDWEEIKEQQCLIISFKSGDIVYDLTQSGNYKSNQGYYATYNEFVGDFILSVKNKDGVLFKVGDIIHSDNRIKSSKIIRFTDFEGSIVAIIQGSGYTGTIDLNDCKLDAEKYSLFDIELAYAKASSTFTLSYSNFIKELKSICGND